MKAAPVALLLALLAVGASAQKLGLAVGNCFSAGERSQWDISTRIRSGSVCIQVATTDNSTLAPTAVLAAVCDDNEPRQVFHYRNSMFMSTAQVRLEWGQSPFFANFFFGADRITDVHCDCRLASACR